MFGFARDRLVDADAPIYGAALARDRWRLAAFALVLLGAGLGLRDPWPADEPRFALVALEMVETGELFFPHRAGQLYPDKPPLFPWAIAGLYRLTGSLRLAFLLPSLLAGLGILWLVHDLGRRLWHRRVGLAAALTLLATVQFVLQAKTAQIDASVAFFTTLGVYGLCRHLLLGPAWRWWYGACFAMGLGVITKGVGFLPLLMLLPWAWARARAWRGLAPVRGWARHGPAGIAVLLAAIGLWLVPMLVLVAQSGDPALESYRNEILWGQTAERYAAFEGHQKDPWFYFVEVVPSLWMPVALFLPWLLPAWLRRSRRRDARYLLLLGWVLAVFLFFSFGSGKRGVYVFPALPALAVACGPLVAARLDRLRGPQWAAFALLAALTLLFSVIAVGGVLGIDSIVEPIARGELEPEVTAPGRLAGTAWGLVSTVALAGVAALLIGRRRRAVPALVVFLWVGWLAYSLWGYRLLDPTRSASRFMVVVAEALEPTETLAMLGWKEQMMLQADRGVTHWGYDKDEHPPELVAARMGAAAAWLAAEPGRVLLLPASWAEPCFDVELARSLGRWHRREWLLLRREGARAPCSAAAVPRYEARWLGRWQAGP